MCVLCALCTMKLNGFPSFTVSIRSDLGSHSVRLVPYQRHFQFFFSPWRRFGFHSLKRQRSVFYYLQYTLLLFVLDWKSWLSGFSQFFIWFLFVLFRSINKKRKEEERKKWTYRMHALTAATTQKCRFTMTLKGNRFKQKCVRHWLSMFLAFRVCEREDAVAVAAGRKKVNQYIDMVSHLNKLISRSRQTKMKTGMSEMRDNRRKHTNGR